MVLVFLWSLFVDFLSFFWSVFSFWALWQLCDFTLSRLKFKLRKPWVMSEDKKPEEGLPENRDRVN